MKKIALFIIVFIFVIITYILTIHLTISLNGQQHVILNVGDEFIEQGAKACFTDIFGACIIKRGMEVENNVEIEKVGTYTEIYTTIFNKNKKQATRIIEVIDEEKPVITVNEEKVKACPNAKDIAIEYTAYDNYDLDLTDKVIKTIKEDQLELEVSDSSGNKDIKLIPIEYVDSEKPTITLKGNQIVYVRKGLSYNEPGYQAIDDCLGDITNVVKVAGNVNTNQVGKYTLTYSVSDGANTNQVQRIIQVYEINNNITSDKVIYLTFDDGPSAYTNELLDTLKKYDVKVTFFITGSGSDEVIRRAYNEGHTIAIHTYSHRYNEVYQSVDAYFNDLNKVQERIKRITGQETRLVRFPGGSSNTVSKITPGIMTTLAQMLEEKGYKYFDWNVASSDTTGINRTAIANNVIKSLKNGSNVVLQHDIKYESVKAVDQIIEYGLANGYSFAPLDISSPTAHHAINN